MRRPQNRPCKGHKTNGDPCPNWAMHGQLVCSAHGGRSPQARAAGQARQTEAAIAGTLGRLGYQPVADPLTALADLAGEVVAWKDLAAEHVARLQEMARNNNVNGAEEVRASIVVFERALDRALAVLGTVAKLNIDERLARISEQRAAAMAEMLRKVLADPKLALTADQRAAVPIALRHVRAS